MSVKINSYFVFHLGPAPDNPLPKPGPEWPPVEPTPAPPPSEPVPTVPPVTSVHFPFHSSTLN